MPAHHHNGHSEHNHHSHGSHDHSEDIEPALQTLLYNEIEFDKIITLNETTSNAGRKVIEKTWPQRLESEPVLVSDADEQLLMVAP